MKVTSKNNSIYTNNVLDDLKIASEILHAARSKNQVLEFTVRIFEKLGFDRIRVWLIDEEGGEFYGGKCNYSPDSFFKKIKGDIALKKDSLYATHALNKKSPFINRKNLLLKKYLHDFKTKETIEFPLIAGKNTLGSIGVDNAESGRPLDLKSIETALLPFVNHVALVLHRVLSDQKIKEVNRQLKSKIEIATSELALRNKELDHLAHHDQLTGLPNRRDFDDRLITEFKKATVKQPLALAMLDIDFFKQINDHKGHLAGDKVIAEIGEVLRRSRSLIYAARYAGDEFVIMLANKKCAEARRTLERINKNIYQKTKQRVSAGVVCYPTSGVLTPLDLVRTADDALYHAKHTGRDRVVCSNDKTTQVISAHKRKQKIQTIEQGGTVIADYILQLEVLNEISELLQNTNNVNAIARGILKVFRKKMGFERIRLYVLDKSKEVFVCSYAIGIKKSTWGELSRNIKEHQSMAIQAVTKREVIDVKDVSKYKAINSKIPKLLGTKATLITPLLFDSRNVNGILVGDYNPDKIKFDSEDYRFFRTLGHQVALALNQAQLFGKVKELNRSLAQKVDTGIQKLHEYSKSLEQKISDNRKLREEERHTHFDIISALVASIESKDVYTRGHSARVANYANQLGRAINLSGERLTNLRYGALLHDLGKLSIDSDLLNKRTALTNTEVELLKKHPAIGHKIVSSIRFLKAASRFILHHHECWDGTGYPSRLKKDKIPLEARVINIADSYDAMITRRSYDHEMKTTDAIKELKNGAGHQFDPRLVKIFIKILKKSLKSKR